MKFKATDLKGAYLIEPELLRDERGFFARIWDKAKFEKLEINPSVAQCNISFNRKKGTLRGMHYQAAPYAEGKLVRCTMGAIYDVIIDLRPESGTYKKWVAVELTAENRRMLYIPEGFAHGFQSLVDNTEVAYQMTEFFHAESARGIRWNDLAFNIIWPIANPIVSKKDLSYPDFQTKT